MSEIVSLRGPVEVIDGRLFLLIPLAVGGNELAKVSRGISVIEGEFLKIEIKTWLAEKLSIKEGSYVSVDNENGKFNLRPSPEE